MPVELSAVAVLKRAPVENVPLTMLKTPEAPDTVPAWLSWVAPLAVVVLRVGALRLSPKLNVPLLTEIIHATVMGKDKGLSAIVQLAVGLFSKSTLVPPGLLTLSSRSTS